MNNIKEQLEFKATMEVNKSLSYLDLTISRNINKIENQPMQISQFNTHLITRGTTKERHSHTT